MSLFLLLSVCHAITNSVLLCETKSCIVLLINFIVTNPKAQYERNEQELMASTNVR